MFGFLLVILVPFGWIKLDFVELSVCHMFFIGFAKLVQINLIL